VDGITRLLPGVALTLPIAAVAMVVGDRVTLLGAAVVALLLGFVVRWPLRARHAPLLPGVRFSSAGLLQLAVVLLGAQVSLGEVARVGVSSLPVMLVTLTACLTTAYVVGRRLGIDADLRTMIGAGTAICGASAIGAVSSVIRPRGSSVTYAISTIFCFNVVAVLVFPPLGHLLGLSQQQFGLFAGTAVNDTSSVVAAASAYGSAATDHAVVVKLARTLMIVPICAALSTRGRATGAGRLLRLVPWFLAGFLAMAAINSAGLLPTSLLGVLRQAATFLTAAAMAAIGFSADPVALRGTGPRPLFLGAILWAVVSATSLLAQAFL